jgi:hypothetical protein
MSRHGVSAFHHLVFLAKIWQGEIGQGIRKR